VRPFSRQAFAPARSKGGERLWEALRTSEKILDGNCIQVLKLAANMEE